MEDKIQQTKLNALSAKLLHRKSKWNYDLYNGIFIILTIIVPLIFIIAQYKSKGTDSEETMNMISFALSIILICTALVSALLLKVNEKITIHKMGLKNNIYIINECDNLGGLTEKDREWFYRYVSEIDNQDNDTFANVSDKKKRKIYREALKEIEPGNYSITCPMCDKSPWKYKKGDCQLCGNKSN